MTETPVQRLARLIGDKFGVVVTPDRFMRTMAGRHQRAAGAVMWEFYDIPSVAGYRPVKELLAHWDDVILYDDGFGKILELEYTKYDKPPTRTNI